MTKIIPVIHTLNINQVKYNIELCANNGVNDIFLIDHRITEQSLINTESYINWIRTNFTNMKIGVNYLQLTPLEAILEANRLQIDYLWADRSHINKDELIHANEVYIYKSKKLLYFGCVAFKYQKPVKDLEWACKTACNFMDVITTSGEETGKPPSVDKIKTMKSYIGEKPLSIASGISSENKHLFEEYADYMLVASSITSSSEIIDENKLKLLF